MKVGGSFGAKTTLTLTANAPLELFVYGVTDEVAARVLLGDTQIGVGKRRSSSEESDNAEQWIAVNVLATEIHRSLHPIELTVELGKAPIQHARTGAEQSFEWREVARVCVHPALAHTASQLVAAVPLAAGAWALTESLSNIGLSSVGRTALDVLVMAASIAPIALASRDRFRGVSRFPRSCGLSVLCAALGVTAMMLEQTVDNRVDAPIVVGNTIVPKGSSRWLPGEFELRQGAIERQNYIVDRASRQRPCVARRDDTTPKPWLFEPWYIARGSSLRVVDRNLIGALPTSERSFCDGRVSSDSICCVETGEGSGDQSVGAISIPTRQREVQRNVRVRWRPATTPLDVEGLGSNTFTVFAWHGLAMRGAARLLRDVESHWLAEPAVRELALDGFSPEAERNVIVTLTSGPSVDVRCPVASSTAHLVRATTPSVRALVVGATRYALSTQRPTLICAANGDLKLVLSESERHDELFTPYALPFSAPFVTIVERQGENEVTIGRAHCPPDAGRYVSVLSVRTIGFEAIERVEQFPWQRRQETLWDSPPDRASARVFFCVATDHRGTPTQESVNQLNPPPSEQLRVVQRGSRAMETGMLYRARLYSLIRASHSMPDAQCCYDPYTGITGVCRRTRFGRRSVLEAGSIPTQCPQALALSLSQQPLAR
ncbi:MAG: hypothetical protein JNK05_40915 [Myxococcales bacterium]|nr:hypothetical protein [Myxococcales bacterium]